MSASDAQGSENGFVDGEHTKIKDQDKRHVIALERLQNYASSLPYSIEPDSDMQKLLDFYLMRIVQCIKAKDYEPGLLQWDSMIDNWVLLKYPIPLDKRIKLARVYYELCVIPGMPVYLLSTWADGLAEFVHSRKKITIEDMRLPWKPVYDILKKELFVPRRQFEISQIPYYMGYVAEVSRRFFHPAAIDEMLETFLPQFDGTSLDSILATQYYLTTFLPLSHPQSYLPLMFRMWESINSYLWDERMLSFLSQLAEMHVDPSVSDPQRINSIPDDAMSEDENRPLWDRSDLDTAGQWPGLWKDVGIFTDAQWAIIMSKCLTSMEIPLADSGSPSTGATVDNQAGYEIGRLPKATWRIYSLAKIIVYSMASDSPILPRSSATTPYSLSDVKSDAVETPGMQKAYLAGCKALDSLSRMIVSTESFFHPSNSGNWTTDLSAFIKYLVSEFNKRWYAERKPDSKTPHHRRLTCLIRRELVCCLRTPALLAAFSRDSTTVSNIQSCFKSMSIMEPELILHPILERAVPSLEALVETQRTTAVIKALAAVALSLVSRDVYYAGSKHLLTILELLLPGIDLNDPTKTLCTTVFLTEISQSIKFGDLTAFPRSVPDTQYIIADIAHLSVDNIPALVIDKLPHGVEPGEIPHLSGAEEAALLRESTRSFPEWVAAFIRRVILLLENLPEDTGGEVRSGTESEIVDAVMNACNQICTHLSEPLYDLALNLIYDYATTTVRPNCVHAVHQLVECISTPNPLKALDRFLPFCITTIQTELQNGASSVRTTSMTSAPLPSDATFHWTMAILRGLMSNEGKALLVYKREILQLFKVLQRKTLSKRGFSRASKLLTTAMLTLTHTYPTEDRFVNPLEWSSKDFQMSHDDHWGKLYDPGKVTVTWHVPTDDEIEFALEILREIIKPSMDILDALLEQSCSGQEAQEIWRNDFCRHLSYVKNAFGGMPTLAKEVTTQDSSFATTDILNEIPEFIATVEPVKAGFVLLDGDPRHMFVMNLRNRFGDFLLRAGRFLRTKGPENTLDAAQMVLRCMRTFLLEYGDSKDGYYAQRDRYESKVNTARRYTGQKAWPRALYVRKARLYHSARLRWNSIERQRTQLHDDLIDEIAEWSMWHYATVRSASQRLLEDLCRTYDGIRRRVFPKLYNALTPNSPDYRVKGVLWQINTPAFAKYAMTEPTLMVDFVKAIFSCQMYEKRSIQNCVSVIADNCLTHFAEPSFVIYSLDLPSMNRAVNALEAVLPVNLVDNELVKKGEKNTRDRIDLHKKIFVELTRTLLNVARSPQTHWKYAIVAIRVLRTLIRREEPIYGPQLSYFLDMARDSNPTMRYYALRGITKALRYIKIRTSCKPDLRELALGINRNPLKKIVDVENPSENYTLRVLASFRSTLDPEVATQVPLLKDQMKSGWLVWASTDERYLMPLPDQSTFQPWEAESIDAVRVVQETCCKQDFWRSLVTHFAEETNQETLTMHNISATKSIFQLLEDVPLLSVQPVITELIDSDDQNKQRAAAELLAGIIGGSKHWTQTAQGRLWAWFTPLIPRILGPNVKTDTLNIWTSFLEYLAWNRDPRRMAPLVTYVMELFEFMDCNDESAFEAVKLASFHRGLAEQFGWKFTAWTDLSIDKYWKELSSEHDEVRSYIADALELSAKVKWRPRLTIPTASCLVKEARILPADFDIMGVHGTYHSDRVQDLVNKFPVWRKQRISGPRAFDSTYDRVAILICKWLYQAIHDVQAVSVFYYILPLMPELFRFGEINDNDELVAHSGLVLDRMCSVTPPGHLIRPLLNHIFHAIKDSPSYKTRLNALPLLQIWYFRQGCSILADEKMVLETLKAVSSSLDDEKIEVREMAGTTLAGILRSSPRDPILMLKRHFVDLSRRKLPPRNAVDYAEALRKLHGAILGICALVDAFPYTIESWTPELLTQILAEHVYDPLPIAATVRKCASNFRKSHIDTWHEDVRRFDEEQLSTLSTMLSGNSYYA